ncbi:hypothetical protein H8D85_01645 [bacterium]|nr:hypothetical protein [bacterium]
MAEGHTHTNDNGVEFSVHKDDQLVDEIEKVAENYSEGNINYTTINSRVRPHSEKSLSITIYDKGLKEAALKYCGKYSDKKRLHKEIFSWEAEAKLAFIGSYISGDGFFHEGQAYISSCNKQLLEQIQWLALSIDIKSTLGKNSHKAGKGFSAQDTFEYTLRFFGDNNSRLSSYCNKIENVDKQKQSGKGGPYEYSSFMLVKIDSIESNAYKGRVYNFEVADNNSYVVQNWAVHNCKVPFDECSICHCKAKTLQNYCGHLKNKMNQVLDDGRKVYAINTRPKFFDLSIVTIPADSTAGFISKLASAESTVVSSAKIAESLKHSELESNADIKKKIEVSADIDMLSKDPKELVYASQGKLSADEIEKLSQYPLEEVLSTFLGLRIMPRQEDFQKLALYSIGQTGLADDLEEHKIVFSPDLEKVVDLPDVKTYNFNEKIAGLLRDSVPQLSLTKPLIVSRAIEKAAAKGWIDEPSIPAGALGEEEQEILFTLLKKHGILETGPKTDSLGWEKQIEGEPSQLKQFIFGHTPDPKLSPHRSPLLPMAGLGAAYTGYAKLMDTENLSGFFKLVKKFPWIMPLIAGAGTVGSLALQDGVFNKTAGAFGPSLLVSVPVSYLMAGAAEAKTRRDEAISPTENFIRKHPFLMALGMSGLASGGLKMIKRAELLSQMDSDSLDDLYNELIDED